MGGKLCLALYMGQKLMAVEATETSATVLLSGHGIELPSGYLCL